MIVYPLQPRTLTDAFLAEGVDFLLIGKGAAILMGYPGTTQDVDVFLQRFPRPRGTGPGRQATLADVPAQPPALGQRRGPRRGDR